MHSTNTSFVATPIARLLLRLLLLIIPTSIALTAQAQELTIKSSDRPIQFLELYTSQGCSSCPPAEKWLNTFVDDERLWKTLFPINLHVDYWDYLGWKDPFAKKQFSQRQRRYNKLARTQNVATPGFVVNGHGWNGWFRRQPLDRKSRLSDTSLEARLESQSLQINVQSEQPDLLFAHVAILGFGIETEIKRGENRGKQLPHDFVVIGYKQVPLSKIANRDNTKEDNQLAVSTHLPSVVEVATARRAIVVWVSSKIQPSPLQVAADWLN